MANRKLIDRVLLKLGNRIAKPPIQKSVTGIRLPTFSPSYTSRYVYATEITLEPNMRYIFFAKLSYGADGANVEAKVGMHFEQTSHVNLFQPDDHSYVCNNGHMVTGSGYVETDDTPFTLKLYFADYSPNLDIKTGTARLLAVPICSWGGRCRTNNYAKEVCA